MSTERNDIEGMQRLQVIAATALVDADYRRRLLDEPKEVLAEAGLEFDDDTDIVVLKSTEKRIFLVLPPDIGNLAELDADEVNLRRLISCLKF